MGPMAPDKYQELLNERDELDEVPVGLERYQAQKCAAIIMAGIAGHSAYAEASGTVAKYLQALALDTFPGIGPTPSTSDRLWQLLDELPWPTPGPPAPQPE